MRFIWALVVVVVGTSFFADVGHAQHVAAHFDPNSISLGHGFAFGFAGLVGDIMSERSRGKLQPLTFVESSQLNRDLPLGTYLKYLLLRLHGTTITTFGSGTPVADQFGTFDNVISRIEVRLNGASIKSCKPYMLKIQEMITGGIRGEACASAGASAVTDDYPVTDVTSFPYGTTGQYTTVRESIVVAFENVYCRNMKEKTWLRTKGASSAELILTTNALTTGLLGYANTAPVVHTGNTFKIDIIPIEQPDTPDSQELWVWRQLTKQEAFTGAQTNWPISLPIGHYLQGVQLLCRDGAAGSTTTATGKVRNNNLVSNWNFTVGGKENRTVKAGTFHLNQAELRNRWGVTAAVATTSQLDGSNYIDFLSDDGRGDLNTVVDVRKEVADSAFLNVDLNSNATFTATATVDLMTDEIIKDPIRVAS